MASACSARSTGPGRNTWRRLGMFRAYWAKGGLVFIRAPSNWMKICGGSWRLLVGRFESYSSLGCFGWSEGVIWGSRMRIEVIWWEVSVGKTRVRYDNDYWFIKGNDGWESRPLLPCQHQPLSLRRKLLLPALFLQVFVSFLPSFSLSLHLCFTVFLCLSLSLSFCNYYSIYSTTLKVFYLKKFLILIYLFVCAACGILVPQPGTEPVPPAVEVQSLNHWTAGKSLK